MRVTAKLGIYGLAVVGVFAAAAAVGATLGPIDVGASSSHSSMVEASPTGDDAGLAGLTIAAGDYRLIADFDGVTADTPAVIMFRIVGADGSAVTDFDVLHDRPLHLIVLSRNLVDYLHLHPTIDSAGSWTLEVPALVAGSYRVYADFQPHGAEQITLAADMLLPGLVEPSDLPAASASSKVDGLVVTLSGTTVTGESDLTFDVARDGVAIVTEPYLGAAGHLVAIREGDLGYLHVHPLDGEPGPVRFVAEFPTPGSYRLFFDFSVGGIVHTASFTVDVDPADSQEPPTGHESHKP